MFTFGSLFAGIGGLDLGLERAGMECKWQVEWDEYCQKVLEKHWPDVRRHGDVKECGKHNLEPVDLVCGGFPCQPVSVAGQRKGNADKRWLWPEFRRIVRELRPRWVVAENVPGLLSIDSGRLMGGILRDLAKGGYDAEWDCIPAAAVGAPHLRYRVFIVAHANRHVQGGEYLKERKQEGGVAVGGGREDVADATKPGLPQRPSQAVARSAPIPQPERQGGRFVADADCLGRDGRPRIFQATGTPGLFPTEGANPWAVEPQLGRVAHGIPRRVDRLRALGNAVVPQVAEWIGKRIMEIERRK